MTCFIRPVLHIQCGERTCIDMVRFTTCKFMSTRMRGGFAIPTCTVFDCDLNQDDQRHNGYVVRCQECKDAEAKS
jgi:hypothetical protein